MSSKTMPERIAALETEVQYLRGELKSVSEKLDSLIDLKNKGAGAFWLASALLGTGIVTTLTMLFDWVKGH